MDKRKSQKLIENQTFSQTEHIIGKSDCAHFADFAFSLNPGVNIKMNTDKKTRIFSSFIKSQLTYCHLLWVFCTKHSIGKINSIHERCLRLIQQNYASDFEVLLENANEKSVHQKCIELLMTEVYKYLNGLSPDIMSDIFNLRENTYNLRNVRIFESQNPRTKKFGLDSIAYRAGQFWKNLAGKNRNSASLPIFMEKIKKVPWILCSSNYCRKHIHHAGFI